MFDILHFTPVYHFINSKYISIYSQVPQILLYSVFSCLEKCDI